MSFHEVRFPKEISYGAEGGPMRKVDIVTLNSGHEQRNTSWAQSRRKYDISYGMKKQTDLDTVLHFYEARYGKLYGFRFKDYADFQTVEPLGSISGSDQIIGVGDGSTTNFQMIKLYSSGGFSYTRTITKPVLNTEIVTIDNVIQSSGYTVDYASGIIIFDTAPISGSVVRAGFEFDVPVRFDIDHLSVNLANWETGAYPNIPLIEVRLDPTLSPIYSDTAQYMIDTFGLTVTCNLTNKLQTVVNVTYPAAVQDV